MGHIRVQDSTKKRLDELYKYVKAKDPSVKTYDDFQNLLLSKVERPNYRKLLKDDVNELSYHAKHYHEDVPEDLITRVMFNIEELLLDDHDARTINILIKRLTELRRELDELR